MIRALALSLSAVMLAAPTVPMHGPIYAGMPPERMRGDSIGIVAYVTDLKLYCGDPGPGMVIFGCHKMVGNTPVTFLENPCLHDYEFWQRIACHEAAHAAWGWGPNHEVS